MMQIITWLNAIIEYLHNRIEFRYLFNSRFSKIKGSVFLRLIGVSVLATDNNATDK